MSCGEALTIATRNGWILEMGDDCGTFWMNASLGDKTLRWERLFDKDPGKFEGFVLNNLLECLT